MGYKFIFIAIIGLLFFSSLRGQEGTPVVLDEVILSDAKLLHFSKGTKVAVLTDSIMQQGGISLTDILRNNSNIYFKENGYGMVSSASFRGTNAQQTAVVWNGITINSPLTGQTDFNTLIPLNVDELVVRSGGGSVQYGSGAIGGSILLNDSFTFNQGWKHRSLLGRGSFNTQKVVHSTTFGREKLSFKLGVGYLASDNDYKYLGTDRRNENGAYTNLNLNASLGYIVSDAFLLKFHHNNFLGDRDFSGTLTAPANENYKDWNARSLVELTNFEGGRVSRLKAAHLYERYRYYPHKDRDGFSFGEANTFIANYDHKQQLGNITLNGLIDMTTARAKGTSIEAAQRDQLSATLLFSQVLSGQWEYGLNLRKDWVSDYSSPFLWAGNATYRPSKNQELTFNTSKNYRAPTFNDRYWSGGGATGNPEVMPETSWQLEVGHALKKKDLQATTRLFAIFSENLIQWRPDLRGIWMAVNVQEATQYGLELGLNWERTWGHQNLLWENEYAYTASVDTSMDMQLMYVPKHRFRSNLAYRYQRITAFTQLLYTGAVYITTDNNMELPDHTVVHLGLDYRLMARKKLQVNLGVKINNIFNKNYQNVAYRPMPNRNYQFQIQTKF